MTPGLAFRQAMLLGELGNVTCSHQDLTVVAAAGLANARIVACCDKGFGHIASDG
jgi:hypothetical protein